MLFTSIGDRFSAPWQEDLDNKWTFAFLGRIIFGDYEPLTFYSLVIQVASDTSLAQVEWFSNILLKMNIMINKLYSEGDKQMARRGLIW